MSTSVLPSEGVVLSTVGAVSSLVVKLHVIDCVVACPSSAIAYQLYSVSSSRLDHSIVAVEPLVTPQSVPIKLPSEAS